MKRKLEVDITSSQDHGTAAVYAAEIVSTESPLYNNIPRNQFSNPMTGQTIGNPLPTNPIGSPTAFSFNIPSMPVPPTTTPYNPITAINASSSSKDAEQKEISLSQAIEQINLKKINLDAEKYKKSNCITVLFDENFTLLALKNCINNINELSYLIKNINLDRKNKYTLVNWLISKLPMKESSKMCAIPCDDMFLAKVIKSEKDFNTLTREIVLSYSSLRLGEILANRMKSHSAHIPKILRKEQSLQKEFSPSIFSSAPFQTNPIGYQQQSLTPTSFLFNAANNRNNMPVFNYQPCHALPLNVYPPAITPTPFHLNATHNRNNIPAFNYQPYHALPVNAYPPAITPRTLTTNPQQLIVAPGNFHPPIAANIQPTKMNAPGPAQGLEREAISLSQAIKRIQIKKVELHAIKINNASYINKLFDKDFTLSDLKNCINNLDELALLVKEAKLDKVNIYNLTNYLISSLPLPTSAVFRSHPCDDVFLAKIIKTEKDFNTLTKDIVHSQPTIPYSEKLTKRMKSRSVYIHKLLESENEPTPEKSSTYPSFFNQPKTTFQPQNELINTNYESPFKKRRISAVEMEIVPELTSSSESQLIIETNTLPAYQSLVSPLSIFTPRVAITKQGLEKLFEENMDEDLTTGYQSI